MSPGQWHLHSCPFYWTFVGRFVRYVGFQDLVIADAIYFTRTGATFDILCRDGLVTRGDGKSLFHVMTETLVLEDGTEIPGGAMIPAQGPKFPWSAKTPWAKS